MNLLERTLRNWFSPYISETDLALWLNVSDQSRYALVKRALASGLLIKVRRGLYALSKELTAKQTHPFELAQRIYGPSYISLESSLSYHGLIPEAVKSITSVTFKRAAEFKTPIGLFSYQTLPKENFFLDVSYIKTSEYQFFIANPWKAICDYVYCYRKDWKSLEPLVESLRIELVDLPPLDKVLAESLKEYYRYARVTAFLKTIIRG